MTNRYETVFILTPVLSDEQAKETVKSLTKQMKDWGAKMVHQENWGMKKLAYPIQKKSTGFYNLLEYEAEGDFIAKLETNFKRDEKVLRFLTTRMDKHALAYAEKRRNKKKEAAAAPAEESK